MKVERGESSSLILCLPPRSAEGRNGLPFRSGRGTCRRRVAKPGFMRISGSLIKLPLYTKILFYGQYIDNRENKNQASTVKEGNRLHPKVKLTSRQLFYSLHKIPISTPISCVRSIEPRSTERSYSPQIFS